MQDVACGWVNNIHLKDKDNLTWLRTMVADSQNITRYFKQITSLHVNKGKSNCRDTKQNKKPAVNIPYLWYIF